MNIKHYAIRMTSLSGFQWSKVKLIALRSSSNNHCRSVSLLLLLHHSISVKFFGLILWFSSILRCTELTKIICNVHFFSEIYARGYVMEYLNLSSQKRLSIQYPRTSKFTNTHSKCTHTKIAFHSLTHLLKLLFLESVLFLFHFRTALFSVHR